MPNLGPTELIIVLVLVIIVFGVGKLPEVGGALGKSIKEFRKHSDADDDAKAKAKADEEAAALDVVRKREAEVERVALEAARKRDAEIDAEVERRVKDRTGSEVARKE